MSVTSKLCTICLFFIGFSAFGQKGKIDIQLLGGVVNQTNLPEYEKPNQFGGYLGVGISKGVNWGRLDATLNFIFLDRELPDPIFNTYKNLSLKGQANYLFKTFSIGEDYFYIGPGLAIHQPFDASGDYNGPSFGANGKVMAPVKISGFPFYITYDFDYITIQGFIRNSIGVSFWL
jgi:hypothetical protein